MSWVLLICVMSPLFAQSKVIYPARHNEWDILQIVAEVIPKNSVIVVGGYDEVITQKISHFWPEGKSSIFEANPHRYRLLAAEHSRGYIRSEIFPWALSETSGVAPFYPSPTSFNPSSGSLFSAAEGWEWYYHSQPAEQVFCKNLQEWADERGLQKVDFLWLNIGGAEFQVLKSCPKLLGAVDVILVATHEKEFRRGIGLFSDLKTLLDNHNLELAHQWKIPHYQGYSLFIRRGFAEVQR